MSSTHTIIAGRYELQRHLATGGMAEVWLATDLTLDRKVAVKWLKPNLATDPIVAERFRREAIAAASLNHPNIVAVHDVFEHEGRQAVVMQLVDGKSLRQLLDTQKRLSAALTCHIGIAVANALDHAHSAGFVHRDVKPGNIMIVPDGRVLLTDFGIAKGLGEAGDDLTSENIMMGTAKYLSPEQVRGKRLDGRADFYSLGLVLYECLAGRVPFLGETDADTALARLQRDPTDLARLRATLPVRLVGVIHHLLERRPEDRPATGADLVVELRAASTEGPPEVDPTDERTSPTAPYSAGRLVRAPSDVRGRVADRTRGTRTPPRGKRSRGDDRSGATRRRPSPTGGIERTAAEPRTGASAGSEPIVTGPVDIPGEPPHITGRVPVTRAEPGSAPRSPTPSTRVAVTRADGPPPLRSASSERRADTPPRPARGITQGWNPSATVVAALVVTALVVVALLWLSLRGGAPEPAPIGADSAEATVVATSSTVGVTVARGAVTAAPEARVTEGDAAAVIGDIVAQPFTTLT
ncbi:protein kinase domain-containing protein [Ilumatobacter sp.]|uniref:serine/threonine-protein kinase n=1 Tax=Ilumatobacter sp. TaxID=1967498 RepID=UPI003B519CAF